MTIVLTREDAPLPPVPQEYGGTNVRVLGADEDVAQLRRRHRQDFCARLASGGLTVLPAACAQWWPEK